MRQRLLALAAALILGTTGMLAETATFQVSDPLGRNVVQFRTSAPLEDIVGTTNVLEGTVEVDPKNLKATALSARFRVDVASLETGIGLRDRHMREQYLHTNQYPQAEFVLEQLVKTSTKRLDPNQPVKLLARGTFTLHGVTRQVQVPVEVTYMPASQATMGKLPGNLIRIKSAFKVRLEDHNIERPQMVLLKVGEVAHVSLDAFATDADQASLAAWMEQMKKMMASD